MIIILWERKLIDDNLIHNAPFITIDYILGVSVIFINDKIIR